ncbi:hypothetical protein PAMP_019986 [Pampus punctatissimus]
MDGSDILTEIYTRETTCMHWPEILRALIPGQKESAFSTRAVSTATAHIKAKTVKSQRDVSLTEWERVFERGVCVCVYMEELNQMVIPPLSLSPITPAPPPPSPNPTLLTSEQPVMAGYGRTRRLSSGMSEHEALPVASENKSEWFSPGLNGHMNEAAITKQAILEDKCYEQVVIEGDDAIKKEEEEEEKVVDFHTWKHFPELHSFKRQIMESNDTLKQLRAARSVMLRLCGWIPIDVEDRGKNMASCRHYYASYDLSHRQQYRLWLSHSLQPQCNTALNLTIQDAVHSARPTGHRVRDHRRLNKPYFIQPPANLPQTVYSQWALLSGVCLWQSYFMPHLPIQSNERLASSDSS